MSTLSNMTNIKIITMFNVAPFATDENRLTFDEVNAESSKYGYLIHPDCCSKLTLQWVKEVARTNYNKTFYKKWEDITSKTRFELLIDQLRHYASTYGTGFSAGNGYVPNDGPDVEIPYENFKVIIPATNREIYDRAVGMFNSGIALEGDTVETLSNFVLYHVKNSGFELDVDKVKNKEVQVKFCDELGITPKDPFALLRYIVYKATGKFMLIKDRATINALKENQDKYCISFLTQEQKIALSSIFYRFKPLFLAMKSQVGSSKSMMSEAFKKAAAKIGVKKIMPTSNASIINEIRRLAKTHHKPFKSGLWETVLCEKKDLEQVKAHLGDITNFKKITLMQGIMAKLQKCNGKMYVIRNGKMWVDADYKPKSDNTSYLMSLYNILEQSIVDSIKDKAGYVVMPKNVHFTVPTSEKNFIGNYPFGTNVDLGNKNNVVGIYWRNEWGTRDFDLHMMDMHGNNYGWCSSYTNGQNSIIYSGDMTNAEPEATELFYFSKEIGSGKVSVNQFSGQPKSQFKLFVATEDMRSKLGRDGYGRRTGGHVVMCDPNNVKAEFIIPVENESCKECALISDNKIYLMDLTSGSGRVPNYKYNDVYLEQLEIKCRSFINLEDILLKAGFTLVDQLPEAKEGEAVPTAVLDLTNPAKDSLIKLFSDEK